MVAAGVPTSGATGALAELCEAYWAPLYAFLRHRGHTPAEAEDLVQGFFAHLIQKASLAAADPQRGRFRSFLIASLKNYAANEHDRARAVKRGGRAVQLHLDFAAAEHSYSRAVSTTLTPERIFERQWALGLLDVVLLRLREEYASGGKGTLFAELSPSLTNSDAAETYADIGARLGMSADAAKTAASRLRRRYRELLRQTIADTVASPGEIDDEIRSLFDALAP